MIVTCPNCSKRYMIDDNLLSKDGRQVRCIACHYVWHQAPNISHLVSNPTHKGVIEIPPQTTLSYDKKTSWLGWIFGFSLVLSLFCALIFGRDFVIKLWPEAEKLYTLVGLYSYPPGTGLSIVNTTFQSYQEGPHEMFNVASDVVNTSNRIRSIPSLKIKVLGESIPLNYLQDKEKTAYILDQWEHRLSENSLLPGEQIHFETEPRPKIKGAQQVVIEF
ncbi:MAG: zinc-ribbon domain-containing protein [Alphaproteobacteria bacterium]|jgi:predicted Zn finger-like uncharacterized protein|nr:zinc-ribbon domain-containing protein [Alphaproteobacteria bacterium]MBP7729341.1 zinc-ribbon domain-containing protein [Alphaproteobacteria bacterium]